MQEAVQKENNISADQNIFILQNSSAYNLHWKFYQSGLQNTFMSFHCWMFFLNNHQNIRGTNQIIESKCFLKYLMHKTLGSCFVSWVAIGSAFISQVFCVLKTEKKNISLPHFLIALLLLSLTFHLSVWKGWRRCINIGFG